MRRKVRIEHARRLAVARQRLSGARPKRVTADEIHSLVRAIGCLQLDPTTVVARSHLLVLFSRLGAFARSWSYPALGQRRFMSTGHTRPPSCRRKTARCTSRCRRPRRTDERRRPG